MLISKVSVVVKFQFAVKYQHHVSVLLAIFGCSAGQIGFELSLSLLHSALTVSLSESYVEQSCSETKIGGIKATCRWHHVKYRGQPQPGVTEQFLDHLGIQFCTVDSEKFCENFIFMNSVNRHICNITNS